MNKIKQSKKKKNQKKPIPMKPFFTPEASSILQGLLCLDVNN